MHMSEHLRASEGCAQGALSECDIPYPKCNESIDTDLLDTRHAGSVRLLRLKSRRKLWLKLHLWLGLILGLVLSIWGITGSIWVFGQEIEELVNPSLFNVDPPSNIIKYRRFEELVKAGEAAMSKDARISFAYFPRNEFAALALSFTVTVGGGITEEWQVGVNPYTAVVTGKQLTQRSDRWLPETFMGFIYALHPSLLRLVGGIPAGVMACLIVFSVLSGLILWWPLTGKWRQALVIKRRASIERFNHDLHKTIGCYSAVVLLVILVSGISMVVPRYFVALVEIFSPATYRYFFKSTPRHDSLPIGMPEAIGSINARYPTGRLQWMSAALEPTGAYFACKNDVDVSESWLRHVCFSVDRYTGELLDIDDPSRGTAGEVFMQWQWPLHSGQAFGMPGRILVCLSGLACPILYLTGITRWLQKRRAVESRKARHFL